MSRCRNFPAAELESGFSTPGKTFDSKPDIMTGSQLS